MLKRMTLALLLLALATPSYAQGKLKAVTTFSILADLVKNVGGDRVDVSALVGPNSDAHVYQPSPSDAKMLADGGKIAKTQSAVILEKLIGQFLFDKAAAGGGK